MLSDRQAASLTDIPPMQTDEARTRQIEAHLARYQQIAREIYGIPASQARPISTRPDIAFRPSCAQILPVWEIEQTAWVWRNQILYRTSGESLATEESLSWLQNAGVCDLGAGAISIPLVPTEEVFAKLQEAISSTTAQPVGYAEQSLDGSMTTGVPITQHWELFVWAAMPILGFGLILGVLGRLELKR